MTTAERWERERIRAVLAAYRKHKTVRATAAALGMAKSSVHDIVKRETKP